jgi:DNA replication protein DnaC
MREVADRNIPVKLISPEVASVPWTDVKAELEEKATPLSIVEFQLREMASGKKNADGEYPRRLARIQLSALLDTEHPWHGAVTGARSPRSPNSEITQSVIGAPRSYRNLTLADVEPRPEVTGLKEAVKATREFIAFLPKMLHEGHGLIFTGPPGDGKTMLASIISQAAANSRYHAVMVTSTTYYDWRRPAAGDDEKELAMKAYDADLLVFDEVGGERITDFTLAEMDRLISHRHNRELSTIFTSNLSWADLHDGLGDHLIDRLQERNRVLELDGPSYRGRGAGLERSARMEREQGKRK